MARSPMSQATHCKHGHEWSKENIYTNSKGYTECKACRKRINQKYHNTPRGRRFKIKSVTTLRQKRQAMLSAYKETVGCVICGLKLGQLHFHHLDPKTKIHSISHPAIMGSLEKLATELEKCIVFCPECHVQWHRENN